MKKVKVGRKEVKKIKVGRKEVKKVKAARKEETKEGRKEGGKKQRMEARDEGS